MTLVPWPDIVDTMETGGWCGMDLNPHQTAAATGTAASTSASANPQDEELLDQQARRRAKQVKEQAAASKSGVWGPTHSFDSQETGYMAGGTNATAPKKSSSAADLLSLPSRVIAAVVTTTSTPPATKRKNSTTTSSPRSESNPNQGGSAGSNSEERSSTTSPTDVRALWHRAGRVPAHWQDVIGQACVNHSPCAPRSVAESLAHDYHHPDENAAAANQHQDAVQDHQAPVLGIARMAPPAASGTAAPRAKCRAEQTVQQQQQQQQQQLQTEDSAAARRRMRHWNRLQQQQQVLTEEIEVSATQGVHVVQPPVHALQEKVATLKKAPLHTLEVKSSAVSELERSISELTMRSSYGEQAVMGRIPDNRRMAYYAVGKHHRQSGRGGNRRCYFTGKLILGGAPFYAGSVQQGLRTLVVFCLPSALNLPKESASSSARSPHRASSAGLMSSSHSRASTARSAVSSYQLSDLQRSSLRSKRNSGSSVVSKSMSRLSSLDDLSLSIDGDLDPNWGLDRDYLLKVLPNPDIMLLRTMAKMYPEQFDTLPIQVRDFNKWKLYVKFCFFSGLPITEGEMHYKVRDDIADSIYGEEIVLSHEVMEAVNGESAEMLTLPNQKAFRYLRKHYAQQCSKLEGDRVFLRTSWERVLSEV